MKMKTTLLTLLFIVASIATYAQPALGNTAFGNQTTFGAIASGNSTVNVTVAGWNVTLSNQVISGTPSATISMSIINSEDTMLNMSTPTNHTLQYISMKSSDGSEFKLNSFRFGAVTQANSYIIYGYKDGSFVTGATSTVSLAALNTQTTATYNLVTVSSINAFGNIDEFRIVPSATVTGPVVHRLDDINISTAVASNSAPSFDNGATQNALACGGSLNIGSLLAVTDANNSQTLTWSVSSTPTNGVLSGFNATATSNAGSVTPNGALTYTPNPGFSGTDNFTIQVSDGAATATTSIAVLVNQATWNGSVSTATDNASNWTGCPLSTDVSVIIPSGTPNSPVNVGTTNVRNLQIASGASFTNSSNTTINITGTITNNGTFTSTAGTIGFTGTQAQTIPANIFANNTIQNLTINNAAGVTLGGTLNLTGTLTPTTGVLTTNNFLTLKSTSFNNFARVGAGSSSGGYISGNVTVERSIQANYRRYRFIGHPFTSMPIKEWTDDIDITGAITGSNANNFTVTQSNNPSAFTFIEANANGAINDAGWSAVTSGNTVTTIPAGQGLRVMIRGSKGQAGSLTGGTYTPNAVTLTMTGTLLQGDITLPLSYTSSTQRFNLICNPYASNISFSSLNRVNVDNAAYIYRPSTNNYGAYIAGTSINGVGNILQAGVAFFVRSNAANASITFYETSKSANNPSQTMLRSARSITNRLSLTLVQEATGATDEIALRFGNEPATDRFDSEWDAYNIPVGMDFYIEDDAQTRYCIFHGSELKAPAVENRSVALGFTVAEAGTYTIDAKILDAFTAGHTVYLKDALLNTVTAITAQTSYRFETVAGDVKNRFSLVFKPTRKVADAVVKPVIAAYPNPAKEVLNVTFSGLNAKEAASIRLINAGGKQVKTITLAATAEGKQTISLKGLAKGLYTLQLVQNGAVQTQNIVVD
jgi:hypothetical protein